MRAKILTQGRISRKRWAEIVCVQTFLSSVLTTRKVWQCSTFKCTRYTSACMSIYFLILTVAVAVNAAIILRIVQCCLRPVTSIFHRCLVRELTTCSIAPCIIPWSTLTQGSPTRYHARLVYTHFARLECRSCRGKASYLEERAIPLEYQIV